MSVLGDIGSVLNGIGLCLVGGVGVYNLRLTRQIEKNTNSLVNKLVNAAKVEGAAIERAEVAAAVVVKQAGS
jgi:hypothetical protein